MTEVVTYSKLKSGEWGLRGAGLQPGQRVTVRRKDGSQQPATVGEVVWTGPDGTCLATIQGRSGGSSSEVRTCWECGRRFTYAECRAHDGDWDDKYCGC